MTTNFYFQSGIPGGRTSEQRLIESLITETIKIYGFDVYYLPRTEVNQDVIFSDDQLSRFENAIPLEMYLENVDGYGGEGDLMSKFGIEIRDTATFVVVRSRWEDVVAKDRQSQLVLPNRPAEGDLLYMPMTGSFFEIKKVDAHDPFYQAGKLYVYKLRCELFQYSSEEFNTGIADVDVIEGENSLSSTAFGLSLENGDAITLDNASWLAEDAGKLLYEGWTVEQQDSLADNEDFSRAALDILDFSEINPFGEVVIR